MSSPHHTPSPAGWLVGGLTIAVIAAGVAALLVFGALYGLIVLVAGAVMATGVAAVIAALR